MPTLPEQGVSGIDVDVGVGVFAPVGTPRDVVNTPEALAAKLVITDANIKAE